MLLTEQALFHTFMVMDECLFCFEPRQRLNKDKTGLHSYLYDAAILTDRSGSRGMAAGRSGSWGIGAVRSVHRIAGDIFQSEGRCINAFDGLMTLGACLTAIYCSYYVVMMLA